MSSHDALRALHHAAASGDEKAVTKLLARHPSSWLDATNAKVALNSAIGNGHVAVVSALIAHRHSDEESNSTALHWAAREGHRNLEVQILTNWPDLISVHDAARCGYDEVLNFMLSRKPQPSLSKNVRLQTALFAAVNGGHESTVALLLAKDPALIHVVNSNEETPLQCAKKVSIAKLLLDHKPELIDAVDSRGRTALHLAQFDPSIEMIDFLLEQRPGLSDVVDVDHVNALHWAARCGHREPFFKLLAQNPRSIDVITLENSNLLHSATEAGTPQILDAILELRPEFVFGIDSYGDTALHCVFQGRERSPHWEKIWELNPCALRAVNKDLQTPTMVAIDRGFFSRGNALVLTQKLSWDELIALGALKVKTYLREQLNKQLQVSRKFAEEQCESGLSSALFIPGVIDLVKSYIFFPQQEVEQEDEQPSSKKRFQSESTMRQAALNTKRPKHSSSHFPDEDEE